MSDMNTCHFSANNGRHVEETWNTIFVSFVWDLYSISGYVPRLNKYLDMINLSVN